MAPGEADQLTIGEVETPQPAPNELLIRVAAAGLNRADLLQRRGHYPPPAGASEILGLEVSGHIAATGSQVDSRWRVGDAVCALLAGGGYAEYCVAPAEQCLPVPTHASLVDWAALPEAVFTVWANLFEPRRLFHGERLLIQGGSSGIGTIAIQIAREFGAHVVSTAGTAAKCRSCIDLGCERAFNYREEDWAAGILEWSGGRGVDVILDMVGGDYFPKHLALLAMDGRLIHIAHGSGNKVELDLSTLMRKRLVVTGSTLRSRPVSEKRRLRDSIEQQVWPRFVNGQLRPVIDCIFPLAEAAEAHRRMERGEHVGKILLRMDQGSESLS